MKGEEGCKEVGISAKNCRIEASCPFNSQKRLTEIWAIEVLDCVLGHSKRYLAFPSSAVWLKSCSLSALYELLHRTGNMRSWATQQETIKETPIKHDLVLQKDQVLLGLCCSRCILGKKWKKMLPKRSNFWGFGSSVGCAMDIRNNMFFFVKICLGFRCSGCAVGKTSSTSWLGTLI